MIVLRTTPERFQFQNVLRGLGSVLVLLISFISHGQTTNASYSAENISAPSGFAFGDNMFNFKQKAASKSGVFSKEVYMPSSNSDPRERTLFYDNVSIGTRKVKVHASFLNDQMYRIDLDIKVDSSTLIEEVKMKYGEPDKTYMHQHYWYFKDGTIFLSKGNETSTISYNNSGLEKSLKELNKNQDENKKIQDKKTNSKDF